MPVLAVKRSTRQGTNRDRAGGAGVALEAIGTESTALLLLAATSRRAERIRRAQPAGGSGAGARAASQLRCRDPSSPDKLQTLVRKLIVLRHRDSPVVYGRSFVRRSPRARGTCSRGRGAGPTPLGLALLSDDALERSGTSRTVVRSLGAVSDFRGHQSLSASLRVGARPLDRLRSDRR